MSRPKQKNIMTSSSIYIYVRQDGRITFAVNHHGKRFSVFTGITASEKFSGFNLPSKEPNRKAKLARLTVLYNACEEYLLRNAGSSAEDVKAGMKAIISGDEQPKRTAKTLCDCMADFAATKKSGTASVYNITLARLKKYDSAVTLEDVGKRWLEDYRLHEERRGRKTNGIAVDLRNIRAVFNWAIDNEYTKNYPFRRFTIKSERTSHLFLSAEEMRTIRDYPVEPWQEMYRDLFMLSFYLIGINISDLAQLKLSDYHNGRITYKRNKTGRLYDIKVEKAAEAIIERYKGKEHLLRFLDERAGDTVSFSHQIDKNLKKIGRYEDCKNKRGATVRRCVEPLFPTLTWYTARRSWATIAASLDIPKEVIGKALGHSEWDSTTTDIYIDFDYKKVDEANRRVIRSIDVTE